MGRGWGGGACNLTKFEIMFSSFFLAGPQEGEGGSRVAAKQICIVFFSRKTKRISQFIRLRRKNNYFSLFVTNIYFDQIICKYFQYFQLLRQNYFVLSELFSSYFIPLNKSAHVQTYTTLSTPLRTIGSNSLKIYKYSGPPNKTVSHQSH